MKLKIIIIFTLIFSIATFSLNAETKEEKDAQKKLEKIQKQREDSIDHAKAVEALNSMNFAIMADRLESRFGGTTVSDNLNFVTANPQNAMVQIVPFMAGFNGLNLKGSVTSSNVKTTKKGETVVNFSIFGSTINAQVMLVLYKDSNQARVTISPNFRNGDITMYGKVFPIDVFPQLVEALNQ